MNILYVTSEAVPFCKTGGLADVAGSLPQALAANGDRVSVILPLYERVKNQWGDQLHFERWTFVRLAWRSVYCGLFSLERDGVTWYFVDNEAYFRRSELYGYYDDGERFAFFSRAVTELLKSLPQRPDIVHCNDWQSALVPIYIRDEAVRDNFYKGIRTVITVHNIEYQGRYGEDTVDQLFGLDRGWYNDGTLQMDGDVNLMKGAMLVSDAVTTVSPTYAAQLHDAAYAEGMESVVRMIDWKFSGVVNGLDVAGYDPSHDPALPARYDADHMAGKAACKAALQAEIELSEQYRAEFEANNRYLADEASIAAYRELAEFLAVTPFWGLDEETSIEYDTAIREYLSGLIDIDEFIARIDQKLKMIVLEGQ